MYELDYIAFVFPIIDHLLVRNAKGRVAFELFVKVWRKIEPIPITLMVGLIVERPVINHLLEMILIQALYDFYASVVSGDLKC